MDWDSLMNHNDNLSGDMDVTGGSLWDGTQLETFNVVFYKEDLLKIAQEKHWTASSFDTDVQLTLKTDNT